VSESKSAVAEPEVVPQTEDAKPDEKKKPKRQPRYNVILWNDNFHSYEYVIEMLQKLFGYPIEKGYGMAKEVDTSGRVIVLTTTREHAELKRDQIHAYGPDHRIQACKGAMWASIEPMPSE